jgi:hypothetical protein
MSITRMYPQADAESRQGALLPGLDGANPLGFLAALGAMHLLTLKTKESMPIEPPHSIKMAWTTNSGHWIPVLYSPFAGGELVPILMTSLKRILYQQPFAGNSPDCLGDKLQLTTDDYRKQAEAACRASTSDSRQWTDWMAALATETVTDKRSGDCLKTTLDFTAGQQQFLKMVRSIVQVVSGDCLTRCLFSAWSYSDIGESLRWDPLDEKRRYALSGIDPTNSARNPILTEFGSNALAVAALPLLPMIEGRSLMFSPRGKSMRWAIWSGELTLDTVRSLLNSPYVYGDSCETSFHRAIGLTAVFESSVVLPSGYYRSFTPSRCIA